MPHQNLPGHIVGNPSEGSSRARSGWTRAAQSCSRSSVWRFRRMSEGPSRPRGGSKTARHTAPRRGLGPLLPSRSRPLRRPPTRHVPASPAPRDLLPLAWPIFRPVPSTSLDQPARELHAAVCLRALPRQRPRHAESASSRYHVAYSMYTELDNTAHTAGSDKLSARRGAGTLFVRRRLGRLSTRRAPVLHRPGRDITISRAPGAPSLNSPRI